MRMARVAAQKRVRKVATDFASGVNGQAMTGICLVCGYYDLNETRITLTPAAAFWWVCTHPTDGWGAQPRGL